jgi:hypothetical protein
MGFISPLNPLYMVQWAMVEGPMGALDDRPRPGEKPTITLSARTWLGLLECRS